MAVTLHATDGTRYWTLDGFTAEAAALIDQPDHVVWIDTDEHTERVEAFLRDRLAVHPLVVEDVFQEQMTPKLEDWGAYLYLVIHGVRRDAQAPEALGTTELDILLGSRWVFTHISRPMRSVEELRAELARSPRILQRGPAYIAHSIVDRIADHYLPVVDEFDDRIDEIGEQIFDGPSPQVLEQLYSLRPSLQRLRRVAVYQRDVLLRVTKGEFEVIPERAVPFFRDIHDSFVRIADHADAYRETVNAATQMYLNTTANRTNEIMKVLAIISTLMLPLSFIAGVYGMNFRQMPELDWWWGYPAVLVLMLAVAGGLLHFFRRKKWI